MAITDHIRWAVGEHKDVAALNQFVCADPPKAIYDAHRGKFHPAPWELEVQSGIRDLRLPLPETEGLILGFDARDGGVASAARISFDIEGTQMLILAVAVRVDLRNEGLGSRTLAMAVSVLESNKKPNGLDCGIWARIHNQNVPSQRLFESAGFEKIEQDGETKLDFWLLD